jgi:hypothetical protein
MGALYHGQLDALDFLFRASEREFLVHNPPALVVAAQGGHVSTLDWLARRPNFASMQAKAKLPCMAAAGRGRIAALAWLRAKGYAWSHFTAAAAAGAGRLEALKFLRANGCEWNYEACAEAARGGHLAVLQHLRAEGCPWSPHTTLAALMGGHSSVFAWACANGCPL